MTTTKTKKQWTFPAIPAVLLSMISVQGGASIAKGLFPLLGAAGTTTLRICLSAIILLFLNRPKFHLLTSRQWLYSAVYGICLGGMNLIFYYAIQRIPLGLGVTVEFVGPLTLALLCSRRVYDILWAVMAVTGILLIVPWNSTGVDLWGLLLALLAGTLWAIYIFIGGKISKIMNKFDAVSVGLCFSATIVIPIGIFSGDLAALKAEYILSDYVLLYFQVPYPIHLIWLLLANYPPKHLAF